MCGSCAAATAPAWCCATRSGWRVYLCFLDAREDQRGAPCSPRTSVFADGRGRNSARVGWKNGSGRVSWCVRWTAARLLGRSAGRFVLGRRGEPLPFALRGTLVKAWVVSGGSSPSAMAVVCATGGMLGCLGRETVGGWWVPSRASGMPSCSTSWLSQHSSQALAEKVDPVTWLILLLTNQPPPKFGYPPCVSSVFRISRASRSSRRQKTSHTTHPDSEELVSRSPAARHAPFSPGTYSGPVL